MDIHQTTKIIGARNTMETQMILFQFQKMCDFEIWMPLRVVDIRVIQTVPKFL